MYTSTLSSITALVIILFSVPYHHHLIIATTTAEDGHPHLQLQKKEDNTCSQLKSGELKVLAAGRLLDRFLLVTSSLMVYELPLEVLDYRSPPPPPPPPPSSSFSSSPSLKPSFRLLINHRPTPFSVRFPAAAASLEKRGILEDDKQQQSLLYGFTLSIFKDDKSGGSSSSSGGVSKLKALEYLAFLYRKAFSTKRAKSGKTHQEEKLCVFAVDVHRGDLPALHGNTSSGSLCHDDLNKLVPLSRPPISNLPYSAHYVDVSKVEEEKEEEEEEEGHLAELLFCGSEFSEFLTFYSSTLLKAKKEELEQQKSSEQKQQMDWLSMTFDQVNRLLAYRLYLERKEEKKFKERLARCTRISLSEGSKLVAGFQLNSFSGEEMVLFDDHGVVHVLEDRKVHRTFKRTTVREFIGCNEEVPISISFKRNSLLIAAVVFVAVQLTICGLVGWYFSRDESNVSSNEKGRKKRKSRSSSKGRKKSRKRRSLLSFKSRSLSKRSKSRSSLSAGSKNRKGRSSIRETSSFSRQSVSRKSLQTSTKSRSPSSVSRRQSENKSPASTRSSSTTANFSTCNSRQSSSFAT